MSSIDGDITSQDISKMLKILYRPPPEIKSRSENAIKTSCDLNELIDLAGLSRPAFTRYRRSGAGKNFLMSGVEITHDKNPRITVLNTILQVLAQFTKI